MLLTDSTEDSVEQLQWTNEQEKELALKMREVAKEVGDDNGLGLIRRETPESFHRLLCFTISYKTGTSLYDVQYKFTLFDFICYLYIVNKINEKTPDGDVGGPTPEQRENNFLGMN